MTDAARVRGLRRAATARLIRWSARRHGADRLPLAVNRRRIYIVPGRFGVSLAALLVAMVIGGLNYNSNLGLAFAFLLMSLGLVAMHHCNRNLLGLRIDHDTVVDALAGEPANLSILLHNDAAVARTDIEILGAGARALRSVPARESVRASLSLRFARRGIVRIDRLEIRTRHPFGWFRAWTYVQAPIVAYVAPRPAGDRRPPYAAAVAAGAADAGAAGDEDFAGLRTYQPGMPLKHMAWKVLARGGAASVRSYSGSAAPPEWLDWAALAPLDEETRLAQLCRWLIDAEAAGRVYGLRLPDAELAPARGADHLQACLRALASRPVGA